MATNWKIGWKDPVEKERNLVLIWWISLVIPKWPNVTFTAHPLEKKQKAGEMVYVYVQISTHGWPWGNLTKLGPIPGEALHWGGEWSTCRHGWHLTLTLWHEIWGITRRVQTAKLCYWMVLLPSFPWVHSWQLATTLLLGVLPLPLNLVSRRGTGMPPTPAKMDFGLGSIATKTAAATTHLFYPGVEMVLVIMSGTMTGGERVKKPFAPLPYLQDCSLHSFKK